MVKKASEQVLCLNYSVIKALVVIQSSDNLSNKSEQQHDISTFAHRLTTQEPSLNNTEQ